MIKENKFTLNNVSPYVEKAHEGQVDKGGLPYFNHLTRVVNNAVEYLKELPEGLLSEEDKNQTILLALCHDLLEDTAETEEELLQRRNDLRALGASELFIERLNMLSRLGEFKDISYMDWIREITNQEDMVTIIVKLSDNKDNNNPERIAQLPVEQQSISNRYDRAYKILKQGYDDFLENDRYIVKP